MDSRRYLSTGVYRTGSGLAWLMLSMHYSALQLRSGEKDHGVAAVAKKLQFYLGHSRERERQWRKKHKKNIFVS